MSISTHVFGLERKTEYLLETLKACGEHANSAHKEGGENRNPNPKANILTTKPMFPPPGSSFI